jgi:predicted Zn-dependent protease with MMP-like domain
MGITMVKHVTHIAMKTKFEKLMEDHIETDKEFQDKINRVIYGEDINDKGMKHKVDDIHNILTSVRSVRGFFEGVGTSLRWFLVIGAVISLITGWWKAIPLWIMSLLK